MLYDVELENTLLNILLQDNEQRIKILQHNEYHHIFYEKKNQLLYELMLNMYNDSKPIDSILILEEWNRQILAFKDDLPIQHIIAISNIRESFVHCNCISYFKILIDLYQRRKIVELLDNIDIAAKEKQVSIEDIIVGIQNEIIDVIQINLEQDTAIQIAQKSLFKNNSADRIYTYIPSIDKHIKGILRGECTIIGARALHSKTALCIQIAINNLLRGKKVLYITTNENRIDIVHKIYANMLNFNISKFIENKFTDIEKEKIEKLQSKIEPILENLFITKSDSVGNIIAKQNKYQADIVIVDFIQGLEEVMGSLKNTSLALIQLKKLAENSNSCCILVSQVTKDLSRRVNANPNLNDLPDTSLWESIAHHILLLNRMYKITYSIEQYNILNIQIFSKRNDSVSLDVFISPNTVRVGIVTENINYPFNLNKE